MGERLKLVKRILSPIYRKLRFAKIVAAQYSSVLSQRGKKTIWLFGAPNHGNLGDQAQSFCIEKWCRQNYPEYDFIAFNQFSNETEYSVLRLLRKRIGKNDKLFCHSGYHFCEMYPLVEIYMRVASLFPDYPILIFPQTINFISVEYAQHVGKVFDSHGKCTLLCRDEVSYNKAKAIFSNTKLVLFPDIVTTLIGTKKFDFSRHDILFCIRNGKEKFYTDSQIENLRKKFMDAKINTETTDTDCNLRVTEIRKHRELVINNKLQDFSRYRVVITDRYHGTIFSLIAGTPVIVISSADHKLSSGVKWFPRNIFKDYINFASDLDEAYNIAVELIHNFIPFELPNYFSQEYYSKLKFLLEGQ